jgi:hypothetical protein
MATVLIKHFRHKHKKLFWSYRDQNTGPAGDEMQQYDRFANIVHFGGQRCASMKLD